MVKLQFADTVDFSRSITRCFGIHPQQTDLQESLLKDLPEIHFNPAYLLNCSFDRLDRNPLVSNFHDSF